MDGFCFCSFFKECPHPDDKQRKELSRELGLEPLQVKFWFQNKRTQMKVLILGNVYVHPFFEFRVRSIILSSWFSGMSFLPSFLSFFGFVGLRYKILTLVYNLGNDCNYFGLTPNSAWVCEIRALWYSGYVLLANIYELNVFQW